MKRLQVTQDERAQNAQAEREANMRAMEERISKQKADAQAQREQAEKERAERQATQAKAMADQAEKTRQMKVGHLRMLPNWEFLFHCYVRCQPSSGLHAFLILL